jgi:FkbM family methyltransferase
MLIPFNHLFQKYNIHTSGVLHLGANTGQEFEEYARLGIREIIWVEALPDLFSELIKKVRATDDALCICVSDKDDELVTFNVASNGGQSSSILEFGTHSKEHPSVVFTRQIEIRTSRIDSAFKERGIEIEEDDWFLNIDLQGAELKALKGMDTLLHHFKYAYIEVNEKELYKGCPLVGEIDMYLAGFGFVGKEVKMTGAGWGDKLYIRE